MQLYFGTYHQPSHISYTLTARHSNFSFRTDNLFPEGCKNIFSKRRENDVNGFYRKRRINVSVWTSFWRHFDDVVLLWCTWLASKISTSKLCKSLTSHWKNKMGGCPCLVVKWGDSRLRGCGFESSLVLRTKQMDFFTSTFCQNNLFV